MGLKVLTSIQNKNNISVRSNEMILKMSVSVFLENKEKRGKKSKKYGSFVDLCLEQDQLKTD